MEGKKILLHICCGICSIHSVLKLRSEGFDILGFFYNPNIHPPQEYVRRLKVAREVSQRLGFPLLEAEYEPQEWFSLIEGLEKEREGGKRCALCFKMRLERTYKEMRQRNLSYFTTTLTISPYKNSRVINELGRLLGRDAFWEEDFKKQDGFKKTMESAKKWGLYRQNYCGCVFSRRDAGNNPEGK